MRCAVLLILYRTSGRHARKLLALFVENMLERPLRRSVKTGTQDHHRAREPLIPGGVPGKKERIASRPGWAGQGIVGGSIGKQEPCYPLGLSK
jgi:hypothetical protein